MRLLDVLLVSRLSFSRAPSPRPRCSGRKVMVPVILVLCGARAALLVIDWSYPPCHYSFKLRFSRLFGLPQPLFPWPPLRHRLLVTVALRRKLATTADCIQPLVAHRQLVFDSSPSLSTPLSAEKPLARRVEQRARDESAARIRG